MKLFQGQYQWWLLEITETENRCLGTIFICSNNEKLYVKLSNNQWWKISLVVLYCKWAAWWRSSCCPTARRTWVCWGRTFLCWYSGWFPQSKDKFMQINLEKFKDELMTYPSCTPPSPSITWDLIQPPVALKRIIIQFLTMDGWMYCKYLIWVHPFSASSFFSVYRLLTYYKSDIAVCGMLFEMMLY